MSKYTESWYMPDFAILFGVAVGIHLVIAETLSAASTEVVVFTETINSDQQTSEQRIGIDTFASVRGHGCNASSCDWRQTSMHLLRWLDDCDFVCSRLLPHQLGSNHLDSRSERDTEVSG